MAVGVSAFGVTVVDCTFFWLLELGVPGLFSTVVGVFDCYFVFGRNVGGFYTRCNGAEYGA